MTPSLPGIDATATVPAATRTATAISSTVFPEALSRSMTPPSGAANHRRGAQSTRHPVSLLLPVGWLRQWSRAVLNRHERVPLDPALHRLLEDGADPAHVVLVVDHAGLERRPLLGEERRRGGGGGRLHAGGERADPEVVLGLALEVLLPRRLTDARVHRHVDARPRAAHARLPR